MQMLRNICIIFLLPLPFFRESCESRISCSSKPPAKEVIFPALLTCFHAHCGDYQSNATQSLHLIHSGFLLKSLMSKIYSKIVPLFPKNQYLCTKITEHHQAMALFHYLIFEGYTPGSQYYTAGDLISHAHIAKTLTVHTPLLV